MISSKYQNFVAKTLATLVLVTTVFTWKAGTDPVNVPKQFLLLIGAFYLGGISIYQLRGLSSGLRQFITISMSALILTLVNPIFFAEAPFTHQVYGVMGRSLGLLTYLSLAIVFFAASTNKSKQLFPWVQVSLQISFIYNSIICLLELNGIEILGYNNMFRVPLGTFGNPNFISAFFGIFASWHAALILSKELSRTKRSLIFIEIAIAIFLILQTNSRQGLLILLASTGVSFYYFVRTSSRWKTYSKLYGFSVLSLGLVGGMGVFNFGPLADLIYKVSISLRIEYWKAAINMMSDHPLSGVGLNSYGDWYRYSRNPSALLTPGSEIVTNSAHNIPLDFGATGGMPLLIAYLLIQGFVIRSILKTTSLLRNYEFRFIALVSSWFAFSLQSLISIDQIGVSIWGWLISGMIISYSYSYESSKLNDLQETQSEKGKKVVKKSIDAIPPLPIITGAIFGVVGLLIALPNFRADLQWGKAMRTGDIGLIKSASESWPQDEMRLGNAAFIFGNNQIWDEALAYANKTIEFNPRSYAVWRMILNNPRADLNLRRLALERMRDLDPNNKSLTDKLLIIDGSK